MKTLIPLFSFLLISNFVISQSIGIGTLTPHASAILDISTINKGFLLPRLTQNQRNSIVSPADGLMIYQIDNSSGIYFFSSGDWKMLTINIANLPYATLDINGKLPTLNLDTANILASKDWTNSLNNQNTFATVASRGRTTNDSIFIKNTLVTNKHYNGGADTLFENDNYVSPLNPTKTGFVHHYYGISNGSGSNSGGDITFFKESGLSGYARTSVLAEKRVVPGQEIWYHQYSAHDGFNSIYSAKSIAAIVKVQAAFNSSLGNMKGWYQVWTTGAGADIDFVLSQGKAAFKAPINLRNSDLIRAVQIYGSVSSTDSLLSPNITTGNMYNQYVNANQWSIRKIGNSFDVLKVNAGSVRPLLIQGNSTHIPMYIYTDAGGAGFTTSLSQINGYYQNTSTGTFNMNNNEVFRYDNSAGVRLGVNTGSGINATFDIRGTTSMVRALLVKDNNSLELFRVNNTGNIIANPSKGSFLVRTTTEVTSAILNVSSTSKGALPVPSMTVIQRNGIVAPSNGLQVYCTDCLADDGNLGVVQIFRTSTNSWKNLF